MYIIKYLSKAFNITEMLFQLTEAMNWIYLLLVYLFGVTCQDCDKQILENVFLLPSNPYIRIAI